jgi:beta-ureidopropionase
MLFRLFQGTRNMTVVKSGLIQVALKGDAENDTPEQIRDKMIEAHIPFIEDAGKQGVQVLSFQEVFTQPYFCPSQDSKWYKAAEKIPDGHTTKLMQEYAKKYNMVIVVPIYEQDITGIYYNTAAVIDADGTYLGKYRKTHIPQVAGFYEKFFFKPGFSDWPVFDTAYLKLGVYICYDRHFPEGWRALALKGAEYVVNPSATVAGLSQYLWKLEQPASAVANGYYVGAINRPGTEAPWNIGKFYGSSYIVSPRGELLVEASEDKDELVVADMDMEMVREVRDQWQFFRDRRPETYPLLTAIGT